MFSISSSGQVINDLDKDEVSTVLPRRLAFDWLATVFQCRTHKLSWWGVRCWDVSRGGIKCTIHFKVNNNTKQDSLLRLHNNDCNNYMANSDIFRLAIQKGKHYWVSMVTMTTWMRRNLTLYAHCLSCYNRVLNPRPQQWRAVPQSRGRNVSLHCLTEYICTSFMAFRCVHYAKQQHTLPEERNPSYWYELCVQRAAFRSNGTVWYR